MVKYVKNIFLLIIISIILLSCGSRNEGVFVTTKDNKIVYQYKDGTIATNSWIRYKNEDYFVDNDGVLLSNTWIDGTYYVNENGIKVKNVMTPSGYNVDSDGMVEEKFRDEIRFKTELLNTRTVKSMKNIFNLSVDDFESINLGKYEQDNNMSNGAEDIEWLVLDIDRTTRQALLLSKYILDCKSYNDDLENVTWETCSLRKWLNEDFYNNAFDEKNKKYVIKSLSQNDRNIVYDVEAGYHTADFVFCLSQLEYYNYLGKIDSDTGDTEVIGYNIKSATYATDYAKNVDNNGTKLWVRESSFDIVDVGDDNNYVLLHFPFVLNNSTYWLRTPGAKSNMAMRVGSYGNIDLRGYNVDTKTLGVRPAIWIEYPDDPINHMIPNDYNISKDIINTKVIADYVEDYENRIQHNQIDTVIMGMYPQSDVSAKILDPIEWFVLEKDENNKRALLMSKYILNFKPYNLTEDYTTWEKSYIRKWLNEDFYEEAFNEKEKSNILTTDVVNNGSTEYSNRTEKYSNFEFEEEKDTKDKIFLIGIDEYNKYNVDKPVADNEKEYRKLYKIYDKKLYNFKRFFIDRTTNYSDSIENELYNSDYYHSVYYWMRTKKFIDKITNSYSVSTINEGKISVANFEINTPYIGVRPLMWIKY